MLESVVIIITSCYAATHDIPVDDLTSRSVKVMAFVNVLTTSSSIASDIVTCIAQCHKKTSRQTSYVSCRTTCQLAKEALA